MKKTIPIVEIFESIQAEGPSLGTPSIFVRVYGCSLHCRFKGVSCDTPYAVSEEKSKAKLMTVDDIIKRIHLYKSTNIVWTGGEPSLYQNFILDVIKGLFPNYTHEVETNGTIPFTKDFRHYVDQFNISLKLKSSNQLNDEYEKKRFNIKALKTFMINKSYFKFVINNTATDIINDIVDIKMILDILEMVHNQKIENDKVYLMPQGTTRKDIIKHSPEVVNLCIEHGFKFSPREHIIIWDGKRGN